MPKKILIVDDEETLCEALRFNLEAEGYEADVAYSAEDALAMGPEKYSLILLDIMLGDVSGMQMAKILKKNPLTASVPIIFCTAKNAEEEMVEGLRIGADDYITKPYSLKNVLARVEAVLRRSADRVPLVGQEEIVYRNLRLSPAEKVCRVNGKEVRMTRKEFEVLLVLLKNRGKLFSRAELLKEVWPEEVVVVDRVVDVHITRIRQKVGEYGKNIVARSGYGYVFVA